MKRPDYFPDPKDVKLHFTPSPGLAKGDKEASRKAAERLLSRKKIPLGDTSIEEMLREIRGDYIED